MASQGIRKFCGFKAYRNDNKGFEGYDVRQGWNVKLLLDGKIKESRNDWDTYASHIIGFNTEAFAHDEAKRLQYLVGSFIQNWIICGLFQAVLARNISCDDIKETAPGSDGEKNSFLSLQPLFKEFVSRRNLISGDTAYHQTTPALLDKALWLLEDIDSLGFPLSGASMIPRPTALSLLTLVNTLHDYSVFWCLPHRSERSGNSRVRSLEYKLRDEGWCPERIKRLRVDIGPEGLYYASLLKSANDHDENHDECSEFACVAHNIKDREAYQQIHQTQYCKCTARECQHKTEDCECRVSYDVERLTEKICTSVTRRAIPLLTAKYKDNKVSVDVTESHEGHDYVAISHVWSDGMGNPKENALLSCQISRIDGFVRKIFDTLELGSDPKFWLDTLCVPVAPPETRASAIESMNRVYADAKLVLVVTSELTSIAMPSTACEVLMRIYQSKWLKRLWTMPEGALAKRLALQFSDRSVTQRRLEEHAAVQFQYTEETTAIPTNRAKHIITNLSNMVGDSKSLEDIFLCLWYGIRGRATSKPSDQAICAAVMCDLNMTQILAAPDESKMIEFWRACKTVPLGVFFVKGPRLNLQTMRWAPREFLDPQTWEVPPPKLGLEATVSKDGLRFSGVKACLLPHLEPPYTPGGIVEFRLAGEPIVYALRLERDVGNPAWSDPRPDWSSTCVFWNFRPTMDNFARGVLVSCKELPEDCLAAQAEAEANTLHARWLAQVVVFIQGGLWSKQLSAPAGAIETGPMLGPNSAQVTLLTSDARVIAKEQRWCIN